MKLLLILVSSVLGSYSNQPQATTCPAFISSVKQLLAPDLLCGSAGGLLYTIPPSNTIFGYIPSSPSEFINMYDTRSGAAMRDNITSFTSKITYDSFYLSLAKEIFTENQQIDDLVFEMFLRLIYSYVGNCTYPAPYTKYFADFTNKDYYDFDIPPFTVFCSLLKKRSTRTVTIIVLDCLKRFYDSRSCSPQNVTFAMGGVSMSVAYAQYLSGLVTKLLQTALDIALISNTLQNTVSSKSFIMLPNSSTNGTGSYVIDVTSSMDKTLVF